MTPAPRAGIRRNGPPAPAPSGKVGRPRSNAAHAAILVATRTLLARDGWSGLTIEGVAAEAGVAKTTVYRRWANKSDLVLDSVADLFAGALMTTSVSPPEDMMRRAAALLSTPEAQASYLALFAESARDQRLRSRVDEVLVAPIRQLVTSHAPRQGLLAGPPDLLFDVIAGALIHRLLVRAEPADEAFVQGLLALVRGEPNPNGQKRAGSR